MSTQPETTARRFGRLDYRATARTVRSMRREYGDGPADALMAGYASVFMADAIKAGQPDHFSAATFHGRCQVLTGDALAEVKASKASAKQAEIAALEAMLAVEGTDTDGTEDAGPFE